ncbi:MAG TPA: FAD-dependent oxidoreductase [Verrucomicrobiota bacterium]|nr:FAD-dependent oxidoreductase [Verrucomicrobiota bacterium]
MRSVLILGGGVIGLACAWHAARRGLRVTVVERLPAARDGCSFGNAGMIVPSHFVPLAAPGMVALGLKWMGNPESPFYIRPRLDAELFGWAWKFWRASTAAHVARAAPLLRDLSLASRAEYEALAEESGNDFGFTRRGLLMLCRTPHALDEEAKTAEHARRLGVPAEVLDAQQIAALEPGVTMNVAGGVLFPKDCHLSPDRLMAGLQKRLAAAGVECLWETEVAAWRHEGGRLVAARTSRGELAADEFVLAGGSWSPRAAAGLGLKLSMQAGKGYSLTLPQPRQLPQLCAIFTEARIAVTPMGGALRFGGTMEIAGLDETINPRRVRGIIRAVPPYWPAFREEDFAGLPPWRGLRPVSPDGLPYLGRTRRWPNLIIATGHAMMGLSLAPVTGRPVGELLAGEPPAHDLTLLAPERYG